MTQSCLDIICLQISEVVIFLLSLIRLNDQFMIEMSNVEFILHSIIYIAYSSIHVLSKQCVIVVVVVLIILSLLMNIFSAYLIALFIDADSDLLKTSCCLSAEGGK